MQRKMSFALLALASAGCAGSGPAAPPAPVEARVSRVFPKTTDLDKSVLSVKLEVYNPRKTPVEVRAVRFALDTQEVAGRVEGTIDAGAKLASEQQAEVGFDIQVSLPADRITALLAKEVLPADLSGTVEFGDGSQSSFDKKTGLALPTLPKVIVVDAQAAQYEKKGVEVTLFLRLLNENAFTLQVQNVTYRVEIEGKEMRSEQAGVGTRLTAGSAEEYEVSMQLDEKSFGKVDKLLAGRTLRYRVVGEVRTKDLVVPFEHAAVIDLGAPSDD